MRLTDPFTWLDDAPASSSRPTREDAPASRGRDVSPKRLPYLHEHGSPPAGLPSLPPLSGTSRITRVSLAAPHFTAHHTLRPASERSATEAVLYLPPLLSALPHAHDHAHARTHNGPTEQELAEFDTRLPDIDPASLALHQALHFFRPTTAAYASTPYDRAFNWADMHLPRDISREWYCVVFRSRRNAASSTLDLYAADREAHEEAVRNGGLVMYWYGVPDATGLNLATCIWQSRRHAVRAISGPKHVAAMRQAASAYEVYDLERWVLKKEHGGTRLQLSKWEGGEVGW
ncbi:hypothetical protein Q5752_003484 [Cryptotrichosporon argae]